MRHEQAERLLDLAFVMQSSAEGVTLTDIQEKYAISRRTAERLRDAVERVFPEIEDFTLDGRIKAWRLRSSGLKQLSYIQAQQLADLQSAIDLLKNNNQHDQAQNLENLLIKLKSVNSNINRIDTDLEALIDAQGYATRVGPHAPINLDIFSPLKDAILAYQKVQITYQARWNDQIKEYTIHPYGFLYGHRHYLVAWSYWVDKQGNEKGAWRYFALPNIISVKNTKESFTRDPNFNLKTHAQQSFGIFQEEPFQVRWKFNPTVAKDAQTHQFHPNQKITKLTDGSVIVSFTAGGQYEMCWYLFRWGDSVEILEPEFLKQCYQDMLQTVLDTLG